MKLKNLDQELEFIRSAEPKQLVAYVVNNRFSARAEKQLIKRGITEASLFYIKAYGLKEPAQVEVFRANRPQLVDAVLESAADPCRTIALRKYVRENVIAPVLERYGFHIENVAHIPINPTGNFVIGGPNGDTGLTGRKIIVDTYGGYFSHGGGAFSGKDPTKVDRSAAYMARYMAKNLVAAGLATKVQVQLAYAIGVAQPVSLRVDSYGTGKISDEKMTELLRETCDMTPAGIIRKLDLRRPIYADTAAHGHFGIESRPWEQTDLADKLRQLSGI